MAGSGRAPFVGGEQLSDEFEGVEGALLGLVVRLRGRCQPSRRVCPPPDQLLHLLICNLYTPRYQGCHEPPRCPALLDHKHSAACMCQSICKHTGQKSLHREGD